MFAPMEFWSVVSLLTAVALATCVVLFYVQRDRRSAPPRLRSSSVWCAPRQRRTTVTLVQQMHSGMVMRHVLDCPLRSSGERCAETCIRAPSAATTPDARAPSRRDAP